MHTPLSHGQHHKHYKLLHRNRVFWASHAALKCQNEKLIIVPHQAQVMPDNFTTRNNAILLPRYTKIQVYLAQMAQFGSV